MAWRRSGASGSADNQGRLRNFLATSSNTKSLPMPLEGGANLRILGLAKVPDRVALPVRGPCHHAAGFLPERRLVCSLNGSLSSAMQMKPALQFPIDSKFSIRTLN